MSTNHCPECGSEVCGHGACPECNPCRECYGGDRSNKFVCEHCGRPGHYAEECPSREEYA